MNNSKSYTRKIFSTNKLIKNFFIGNILLVILTLILESINFGYLDTNILEFSKRFYLAGYEVNFRSAVKVLLGTTGIIITLLSGFSEKMAYEEQKKRDEYMKFIYNKVKILFEESIKLNDMEKAKRVIEELGIEALKENSEWFFTMRSRNIEPPII